jgi:SAM-dependent methyltransferase
LWQVYSRVEGVILPLRINPQLLYKNLLSTYVDENARWLDLGCGRRFFPESLPNSEGDQLALVERSEIVIGIDCDKSALMSNRYIKNKTVGDIGALPFRAESFNVVSANMVVEHVARPDAVLAEINRILKPGGTLVIHTPNTSNYKVALARLVPGAIKRGLIGFLQDRRETDVFRTYYMMNSGKRLYAVAGACGFLIAKISFEQSPADTVMLGPLVIFELLLMKLLSSKPFARFRSNIISVLRKEAIHNNPAGDANSDGGGKSFGHNIPERRPGLFPDTAGRD